MGEITGVKEADKRVMGTAAISLYRFFLLNKE